MLRIGFPLFKYALVLLFSMPEEKLLAQDIDDPRLSIVANQAQGNLVLTAQDELSLTLGLVADTASGIEADWWIVADTPYGLYHYVMGRNTWVPGLGVSASARLFDVPGVEILAVSNLPPGSYDFYFGIDLAPNGSIDPGQLVYTVVSVTVTDQ